MRSRASSGRVVAVSVSERLEEMGGVATRSALLLVLPRSAVDRALCHGEIVADARGCYALPSADEGIRLAHALGGVLSHTSAALHRGWEVKIVPDRPHVIVPRHRRLDPARHARARVHRIDLHPDDVEGIATTVEATLTHCLRSLPYDEALAVADSALRHGIAPATLVRVARTVRGPGSPQVRRVAAAARGEAANPFESTLRAITHDVPGLDARPQGLIVTPHATMRPDLVDDDLRIALEADSFEWHGGRRALSRDARRYNLLVIDGWMVLRFSWEDVIFDADHVRTVLVGAVERARGRTDVATTPGLTA